MSTVTGKEALMQILRAEGVEYVFGIPGATEAQFVDVMEDHPEIKYVLCMHELAAVGMAEGYARTSGKVGFLNLHTGTGLAAGMPMLSNAYWGGVPAGGDGGAAGHPHPGRGSGHVGQPGQDRRALHQVGDRSDPSRGPAHHHAARVQDRHPPAHGAGDGLAAAGRAGQHLRLRVPAERHSYTRLHPDDRSIEAAVELLARRRRTRRIIVEDGVTKCEALDEMVRFAEQIGAPVYQPWMADVNFPVHHPLYIGDLDPNSVATRDILEKFDVLVVVGAMFFMQAIPTPKPLVPAIHQGHPDRQQSLADSQELPRRLRRGGRHQGGAEPI